MITISSYLLIVIQIWFPAAPFLSQGLQPPNIPPQTVTVPIAPGTNTQFQGPIQNPPPPPANNPGQS
jgi:hypothetical protein